MHKLRSVKMPRRNRSIDGGCYLPLYRRVSDGGLQRSFSNSKSWVHLIPVSVLLCFFILWFFSFSVDLEVKDGRITEFPKLEKPISLSETRADVTFSTAASPPYPSTLNVQEEIGQAASESPTGN